QAEEARQRAETAEGQAKEARDGLAVALTGERKAKGELEVTQQQLDQAHRELRRLAYADRISLAQREWDLGRVKVARRLHAECDPTYRGWEWAFLQRAFNTEAAILRGHRGEAWYICFSLDGWRLASVGEDSTARLWDKGGKEIAVLKGMGQAQVRHICSSPDGKRLASASMDGKVRLWDEAGKLTAVIEGHMEGAHYVRFSPDGKLLASSSGDNVVHLWDEAGKEIAELRGHASLVDHICFTPDGKRLA